MKYCIVKKGKFISRPNRFIAYVEIDGRTEICHVKNTGRCKELLIPGVTVFVEESTNPSRKTKYDLIAVKKNEIYVNIDSQAPNKVFYEWLKATDFFGNIITIKPEYKFNNSRFDFYVETKENKILIEVKGVTLEKDGLASFPDAPTLRGLKHVNELVLAKEKGFDSYVFFIIQMDGIHTFVPNRITQPDFADALMEANKNGVGIYALGCEVAPEMIFAKELVEVNLKGGGFFG